MALESCYILISRWGVGKGVDWVYHGLLKPQSPPQGHTSSKKLLILSNSTAPWWPSLVQICGPMAAIIIQTTTAVPLYKVSRHWWCSVSKTQWGLSWITTSRESSYGGGRVACHSWPHSYLSVSSRHLLLPHSYLVLLPKFTCLRI